MMALSQSSVLKVYKSVIDEVINGSRDLFIDEGLDEQIAQELRHLWESKLINSHAVDTGVPITTTTTTTSSNNTAVAQSSTMASTSALAASSTSNNVVVNSIKTENGNSNGKLSEIVKQNINLNAQAVQQVANFATNVAVDGKKMVPIQITLPPKDGAPSIVISIQIPVAVLSERRLTSILTSQVISAAMELPPNLAANLLQDHVNSKLRAEQIDGNRDSSDDDLFGTSIIEEDFDDDNDNDDNDDEEDNDDDDEKPEPETFREEEDEEGTNEEEPLNSEDDVSENDNDDLFETENVVVCQYDKITRSRNKWKFYLKDGIMNLNGKDFVFQKCTGEAEW